MFGVLKKENILIRNEITADVICFTNNNLLLMRSTYVSLNVCSFFHNVKIITGLLMTIISAPSETVSCKPENRGWTRFVLYTIF